MNETTGKTEAGMEVPPKNTSIHLPDSMQFGGGIIGVAGAIVVAVLAFRKRLSKDNLELTKDRAETDIIKTYADQVRALQEHNAKLDDNAREAWRTRAEDAKRIGELTSKVEHLTEINSSLNSTVAHLENRVEFLSSMVRRLLPPADRNRFDVSGNLQQASQLGVQNGLQNS